MKMIVAVAAIGALMALTVSWTTEVSAQASCGPCASAKTLKACVACSEKAYPGRWPQAGKESWCRQNMPACRKPK
jgi:hypothetical protein